MSQFGPMPLNLSNLASSVSGGQQNRPAQNEADRNRAAQDLKQTLDTLSSRQTEDVDEASLDSDRDADGRDSGGPPSRQPQNEHEEAEQNLDRLKTSPRPSDADPMIGQFVDLDG